MKKASFPTNKAYIGSSYRAVEEQLKDALSLTSKHTRACVLGALDGVVVALLQFPVFTLAKTCIHWPHVQLADWGCL